MVLAVGTRVTIEEDAHNEFKMHTRLCLSEIPTRCSASDRGRIVRTMQPASKTISAYLNSGGGRIFIGIDDDRVVKGLRLTRNMIDHFYLNLHYCLNQFNPPVPPGLVKVHFEEVLETDNNVYKNAGSDDDDDDDDFLDSGDITVDKPLSEWYMHEHLVGGKRCNCQSSVTINKSRLYLLVIQVLRPEDGTVYQNEEGLAYRRRNGSNKMLTIDEIRQYINTDFIPQDDRTFLTKLKDSLMSFL